MEAFRRQAEAAMRAIAATPSWLRDTAVPPRAPEPRVVPFGDALDLIVQRNRLEEELAKVEADRDAGWRQHNRSESNLADTLLSLRECEIERDEWKGSAREAVANFHLAELERDAFKDARIPRSVGVSTCPFCDYAGPSKMLAPESWAKQDGVIVIEPINPVTPGHVLVIPTRHVENATDNPEVTGRVFKAAARWARIEGLSAFNLITSTGAAATQTVKHLHVHVVPRREGDGLALPWAANSHSGPGS